ncbi:MAG TPA: cell envelope integrity protein TolA [Steroidobacteraceae bacterium]|nr:cell envelope integrity protein TolA [Steroidobacteraceae bacterium]
MSEPARDRWLSIGMSVLLHGSLVALLAIGWWHFRSRPPAPSVPIDATVVDARTLKGVGTASTPAPKPKPAPPAQPPQQVPPPEPQMEGPPPPTPDEMAMREQAAKLEAQHEAEAQQELLARQQAAEAQRKAEAAAAEQAAQARKAEEAKAAAQAKKLAEAKKAAEATKLAEARKKAEAKLAAEKKAAEEKKLAEERQAAADRAARLADLQQSLQEEERAQAARAASGALASWQSQITSRIQNAWIKPPTAQPGILCVLNVSLVPGGSVTGVSIGQCNGDDAVRQSIQTAVYNASPLPPPPNGIPFPRQLIITFKPTT